MKLLKFTDKTEEAGIDSESKISIEPEIKEFDSIESEVFIEIASAVMKPVMLLEPIGATVNRTTKTARKITAGSKFSISFLINYFTSP